MPYSQDLLKRVAFVFLIVQLISYNCHSQIIVKGIVRDSLSQNPLPFASVSVVNTNKGTISNEEGVFMVSVGKHDLQIAISYIGYKSQIIDIDKNDSLLQILLVQVKHSLGELVISADDDYLYDMVMKVRKKLKKSESVQSKLYFKNYTDESEKPLELLECYFNAYYTNSHLDSLQIKNGRIGLSTDDEGYFTNRNPSRFIKHVNLLYRKEFFPLIPLQLNKKELKTNYSITRIPFLGDSIIILELTPKSDLQTYFTCRMWLDLKEYALYKLSLTCERTDRHPFQPIFSNDKIKNVAFNITYDFKGLNKLSKLEYIDINYSYEYHRIDTSVLLRPINDKRIIRTHSLYYFYDPNDLFFIPSIEFDRDIGDYWQISMVSLNKDFWRIQKGLRHTKKEKEKIEYFTKNGIIVNFNNFNFMLELSKRKTKIFEYNNILWNEKTRLKLEEDVEQTEVYSDIDINWFTESQYYKLNALIFIDVNKTGDSIQYYTTTVFDVFNTYFHLSPNDYTDCWINIYFDLFEVYRRKLEAKLKAKRWTDKMEVIEIYERINQEISDKSEDYLFEVKLGRDYLKLLEWNDFVLSELGIDNLALAGLKK